MIAKKKILCTLFALIPLLALGQQKNVFKKEWNVGVGFGSTFSSVNFANTSYNYYQVATKSLQQYQGGLAIRYISEKHLGLIAELNYSQQGWKEDFSSFQPVNLPAFAYSRRLDYLELPLLTHIYFGRKVRAFINLGPKFSVLMGDKENMNQALADYLASGQASDARPTDQYFRKPQHRFDYGLMGGAGMEFRSPIGCFSLEGRYYFGLSDIYSSGKSDFFARSANRVASVKLTYYTDLFK